MHVPFTWNVEFDFLCEKSNGRRRLWDCVRAVKGWEKESDVNMIHSGDSICLTIDEMLAAQLYFQTGILRFAKTEELAKKLDATPDNVPYAGEEA